MKVNVVEVTRAAMALRGQGNAVTAAPGNHDLVGPPISFEGNQYSLRQIGPKHRAAVPEFSQAAARASTASETTLNQLGKAITVEADQMDRFLRDVKLLDDADGDAHAATALNGAWNHPR